MVSKLKIINAVLSRKFETLNTINLNYWGIDETLEFIEHLYDINIKFEKNNFYATKKDIQYTDFISVVICFLNIKEQKYVEYYLENYKSKIVSDSRPDTINL